MGREWRMRAHQLRRISKSFRGPHRASASFQKRNHRLYLLPLCLMASAALGQSNRGNDGATAPNPLDISGRPEAPLVSPEQLPRPSEPSIGTPLIFEPLDSTDFLRNPEMFLFDDESTFKVDLKTLQQDLAKLPSR